MFGNPRNDAVHMRIPNKNLPSYINNALVQCSKNAPTNNIPKISQVEPVIIDGIHDTDVNIIERGTYVNKFSDICKKYSPRLLDKTKAWFDSTSSEIYWQLYNLGVDENNFNICIISGGCLLRRSINGVIPYDRVNIIFNHFVTIFRDQATDVTKKSDLADVFITCLDKNIYREIIAEATGWLEGQRAELVPRDKNFLAKTIYNHTQNVHSSGLSESVNNTLYIFSKNHIKEDVYKTLTDIRNYFSNDDRVNKALDRINIDTAVFPYGFQLRNVIQHVWFRVKESPHSAELKLRLKEELYESVEYCSTGYLTRIINTLSGFDDDVSMGVGFRDEIYTTIVKKIQVETELQENKDDIIDGFSLSDTRTESIACEFINKIKEKMADDIFEEYKNTDLDRSKFNLFFEGGIIKFFPKYK